MRTTVRIVLSLCVCLALSGSLRAADVALPAQVPGEGQVRPGQPPIPPPTQPVPVPPRPTPPPPVPPPPDPPPPAPTPAPVQPTALPADGSGPLVRFIELRFHPVNESIVEAQTYLYYIQTQPSRSSDGVWVPYSDETEKRLLEDFKRLWATNFLDNLWIEVEDAPYANGVIGKRIIFNMEERPRVKIVDYTGTGKVERTKVDEKMREQGISLRLDSFLDQAAIRRTETLLRGMMAEKGHQFADISHTVEELPGGPKLVKVVFNVDQGPKVKIRSIDFVGNEAITDGKLKKQMKETKEHWFLSFITSRGTYQEAKFEEDADKVVEYFRNQGHIQARVGTPEIKTLEDSTDKETRWVQLVIPVTEGPRFRVGEFAFDGNKVVKSEILRPLFKLKAGDWYSEKRVRTGLEKSRELYGGGGYFEFTGFPDLAPQEAAVGPMAGPAQPTVNVTMKMQEGEQYFVNRVTFTGNTTTRDNVIRREMRLLEGGVFNTEALKYSVRRLNQLGYFQNLEGNQDIGVEKTPNSKNEVDVTLKLKEQNRNQLTFGAGVSQYEGFFGQLSFQTSNFMGRGESLTLSAQAGSRAENYQVAFSEPFLFDRNITGGVDIYRRSIQYISQFTQKATGGNVLFGFPVADFSRLYATYSYEQVKVTDLNEYLIDSSCILTEEGCQDISLDDLGSLDPALLEILNRNPFLYDSLLVGQQGRRTVSKVTPSFVFNTVDNPIFPNTGRRLTMSFDFAGVGGNTNFIKPRVEAVAFFKHTNRTSVGFRGQLEYIKPYGSTTALPIFERLFLGGEYSVRGFDVRSIGPRENTNLIVVGGNKSLLFNAEYLVTIAQPVRLVLFYDAGQALNNGQNYAINQFRTSTGAEIRFFMPVLNVPFRLIFAYNPQRDGVLDNSRNPAKKFAFRFAVGSTF